LIILNCYLIKEDIMSCLAEPEGWYEKTLWEKLLDIVAHSILWLAIVCIVTALLFVGIMFFIADPIAGAAIGCGLIIIISIGWAWRRVGDF